MIRYTRSLQILGMTDQIKRAKPCLFIPCHITITGTECKTMEETRSFLQFSKRDTTINLIFYSIIIPNFVYILWFKESTDYCILNLLVIAQFLDLIVEPGMI